MNWKIEIYFYQWIIIIIKGGKPGNFTLELEYKSYTKILNKVINGAKVIYNREQVENKCGRPRNLWKVINQKLGNGNRKCNNINLWWKKK